MNEEKAEYRNKQRSSFWWACIMWALLLLLAYFGAEIIKQGEQLNGMTQQPVWGYVLWGGIFVALWVLVLGPVIHFTNLRYVGEESLRRQVARAMAALSPYLREPEESELRQIAEEFRAAPRDFTSLEAKYGWQELLARFREAVHGRAHDTIIGYCKAVGVGMVFAFNGLLDGFLLFAVQLRLVLELARVYGYKPTSFSNGCFMGWIAANSLVVALTSGLVTAAASSFVASMLGAAEGADIGSVRAGLEMVVAVLMQALIAGILVYMTGRAFLWRLEHEGREVALKTLLRLSVEGRREYAAKLLGASAALGLLEDEKQPTAPLSGRLLQLFGQQRKPHAGSQAALMGSEAAAEGSKELPRPKAEDKEAAAAPAPATPALEPQAAAVVATPALEQPLAAAKPEPVEEALRGEGVSS